MSYLSVNDFSELYGCTPELVRATHKRGNHNRAFKKKGKTLYVDKTYFDRRLKFRKAVTDFGQDVCYLLEEHFSLSEISRTLLSNNGERRTEAKINSMSMYLSGDLFAREESSVFVTDIPKRLEMLAKYGWKIERRLRRRGTSISKILDRRMSET
jgi:hypothetical protein